MGHSEEQLTDQRNHLGMRWSALLLGASTAAIVLHLLVGTAVLSFLTMTTVVAATLTMIGVGLWRHRPAHPLPWYALSASAVLFTIGTALRDVGDQGLRPFDDLFTLAYYFGFGLAATLWLRPRQVRGNWDLLLDFALLGLAALLTSWTFLISPILQTRATTLTTVMAAIYPILDALLLTLLAHSVATTTRSETSLRLLHFGLIAVLVGDLGSSLETAGTASIGRKALLAALLVGYAAVGVAALHPAMATLGTPRRIHPHHARQRASLIAVALIAASLVPVVGSSLNRIDRVVVSSLLALLLIGVLVRSERAIVRSERAIVRSSRSERRAQYQADHDTLTGLLNRSALLRMLHRDHERWAGQPMSLLFIDLDDFKAVNDSYGHAVGDELIANAASRIRRVIRRADMAARYGGDEFVVLAALGRQEAAVLAERLLGAFIRPFDLSAGEVAITASIGVACGSPRSSAATIDDLIRDADSAMYHAKESSLGYAFRDEIRHGPPAEATRRGRRSGNRTASTAV